MESLEHMPVQKECPGRYVTVSELSDEELKEAGEILRERVRTMEAKTQALKNSPDPFKNRKIPLIGGKNL
jgi:hypothetical protein